MPVQTKAKNKVWDVLIIMLTVILVAMIGVVGYLYFNHKNAAEPMAAEVGFPVETAFHGCEHPPELAWEYAATPSAIRSKEIYTPEAMEFVAGYHEYGLTTQNMDITEDVAGEDFPLLIQWDTRWGYQLYGTNYMGNNGCGPTALAIVYAGLTGKTDWNPWQIACYAIANNLYVSQVGTKWVLMEIGGEYLGLTVDVIGEEKELARTALEEGKVLILEVGPGDFTSGGHFIVVTELLENNEVVVRDPNSREKSAVTWEYDRVMEQANYVWAYTYG